MALFLAFMMMIEKDRKVWEIEGKACSKGPGKESKPGSLRSGLSLIWYTL